MLQEKYIIPSDKPVLHEKNIEKILYVLKYNYMIKNKID